MGFWFVQGRRYRRSHELVRGGLISGKKFHQEISSAGFFKIEAIAFIHAFGRLYV